MKTDRLVADASVLLKWYFSEGESSRGQALRLYERFRQGEVRILLPDLALYELGNRFARQGQKGLELLQDAFGLLTDLYPLHQKELIEAAELAALGLHKGLPKATVYDAAYVILAKTMDCPLITADEIQARLAHLKGAKVIPLEEYV